MTQAAALPVSVAGARLRLAVHLVPKAAGNRIIGVVMDGHGGQALKAAVSAPPENGKANAALIRLLAAHFDLPPRDLRIVSGHAHRRKVIEFDGDAAILRGVVTAKLLGAARG